MLSAWLVGAPAWAQSAAPDNETCQTCHAEPSVTRSDGRPVLVHPETFASSVHAPFACVDCHADLATTTDFPHPERLQPVDCASCHDQPAMQLAASVHARGAATGTGATGCLSCHGPPHAIRSSSDPESATNKLHVAATCGACHSEVAPAADTAPRVAELFADSIHGRALSRSGLIVAPTCTDCHRSHDVVSKASGESPVHPTNVPATCGTCHAGAAREFMESAHAMALQAGNTGAPQCSSCHTAHTITRTEGDRWQLDAVEQCGTCHREALATYRDTFHGQVTALGFTPVAKCVDCHESHGIFRKDDPRSPVAAANLVATCSTCHPSASPNFVRYQPHANKDDRERSPALFYTSRFMNGLLLGVFAFFGLHSALWFVRERTGPGEGGRRG